MLDDFSFSGTILAWVPKPNKDSRNEESIPDCWVECDGGQILKGNWKGQRTPELNNKELFLRGGMTNDILETQDDALEEHEHNIHDPGHYHSYKDSYVSWRFSGNKDGHWGPTKADKIRDRWDDSKDQRSDRSFSGIGIKTVKSARVASETRPKNMKVTFIIKVC